MDKKLNGNTFIFSLAVYEHIHILTYKHTHIHTHKYTLYEYTKYTFNYNILT